MIRLLPLLLILGCGLSRNRDVDNDIEYPLLMGEDADVTVMIDVYSPKSYNLYFDNSGRLRSVIFVTHRYGRRRPSVTSKVSFEETNITFALPELGECSVYVDYNSDGLDGSSLWIQYGDSDLRKYWNPASQKNTAVGSFYFQLSNSLSETIGIDSLKEEFLISLPPGRYWNFGEGVIKL
ncbi:hypothetical protein [Lewinella sp. JB7]|uniref:hypothetical protein n=1 Tax=Lewinella sp. JB7 TaxID=2962887 RepID=UPI0020C9401D|nr:hypothetical protein [Lewinella sp. JB7]MCP9234702.1 hypothetical protein [Lewinella sp. JB7]